MNGVRVQQYVLNFPIIVLIMVKLLMLREKHLEIIVNLFLYSQFLVKYIPFQKMTNVCIFA